VSEEVGELIKNVTGAVDVVVDPVRGKGTIEVITDRLRAARAGVSAEAINEAVDTAIAGRVATMTIQGRERHPVRVRYGRDWREDEESIKHVLVPRGTPERREITDYIAVDDVATVRTAEGLATIKSENGLLRNYVRLNVRGRNATDFVSEAKRVVAKGINLPP